MSYRLSIKTLGGLQITFDGEPLPPLASRKAEALLVYLAIRRGLHAREQLVDLLWQEVEPARGLANLSVLLSSIRKHLPDHIIANASSIGFREDAAIHLDVLDLETQIEEVRKQIGSTNVLTEAAAEDLQAALQLYRGDFLAGYYVRGSQGFEEWAALERERLQNIAFEAIELLSRHYFFTGQYANALHLTRRLLRIDPYREETHRQVMRLLVRSGRRRDALKQYEKLELLLKEELGVSPSPVTADLYERILHSGLQPVHNLPARSTPFIGRRSEIAEIAGRLAHPDCSLLTLVGPGGVGKSRLAEEVAFRQLDAFLNGVLFIPLEELDTADLLPAHISKAAGFTFQSGLQPEEDQLLHYLKDKELLLVLDNMEHLLPLDGFLERMLGVARGVKVLATSRSRLNLREEWLYDVGGFDGDAVADGQALFVSMARRVHPGFALADEDIPNMEKLLQLVGGFPLAIELAAGWVRALSLQDIVREIAAGVDILSSRLNDMDDRHRSMRTVLEHSWALMSKTEQRVLSRLSVFRGGFNLRAAEQVSEATLSTLSGFVDKSLIARIEKRYRIHSLLRRFAGEQLAGDPDQAEEVHRDHMVYFLRLLKELGEKLITTDLHQAVEVIDSEFQNIRSAWLYAAEVGAREDLSETADSLYEYHKIRGLFKEGVEILSTAFRSCPDAFRLRARLGALQLYIGDYSTAEAHLTAGYTAAIDAGDLEEQAFCGLNLANLARRQGKYDALIEHVERVLELQDWDDASWVSRRAHYLLGMAALRKGQIKQADQYLRQVLHGEGLQSYPRQKLSTLNALGDLACHLGDYDTAKEYFGESLALSRKIGDRYWTGVQMNNIGTVFHVLKDFEQARAHYEESLKISRELGDFDGQLYAFSNLGEAAFDMGDLESAREYYNRAYVLARENGSVRMEIVALKNLGAAASAAGDFSEARSKLRLALHMTEEIDAQPLRMDVLLQIARMWEKQDRIREAVRLLQFLVDQPATEQHILDDAKARLEKLEPSPSGIDPILKEWVEGLLKSDLI